MDEYFGGVIRWAVYCYVFQNKTIHERTIDVIHKDRIDLICYQCNMTPIKRIIFVNRWDFIRPITDMQLNDKTGEEIKLGDTIFTYIDTFNGGNPKQYRHFLTTTPIYYMAAIKNCCLFLWLPVKMAI